MPNKGSKFATDCKLLFEQFCLLIDRFAGCDFSYFSCKSLASVLRLQHSHLKELDLSNNFDLKDTGLTELNIALIHSNCRLEKLGYLIYFLASTFNLFVFVFLFSILYYNNVLKGTETFSIETIIALQINLICCCKVNILCCHFCIKTPQVSPCLNALLKSPRKIIEFFLFLAG